jgi:hypothetical protein
LWRYRNATIDLNLCNFRTSLKKSVRNLNSKLQISKTSLERYTQDTSLFGSAASRQRGGINLSQLRLHFINLHPLESTCRLYLQCNKTSSAKDYKMTQSNNYRPTSDVKRAGVGSTNILQGCMVVLSLTVLDQNRCQSVYILVDDANKDEECIAYIVIDRYFLVSLHL